MGQDNGAERDAPNPARRWTSRAPVGGLIQLVSLALFVPLSFFADNWASQPSLGPLLSIGIIAAAVALVVLLALSTWFRVQPRRALALVSLLLILFFTWGDVEERFRAGSATVAATIALGLLVLASIWRWSQTTEFVGVVLIFSLCLVLYPTAEIALLMMSVGEVQLSTPWIPESMITAEREPDVYLLVLDSYGRADVFDLLYGYGNAGFLDELVAKRFQVATNATANYSMTHFSIGSALSMAYLADEGQEVSQADRIELYRIMQGGNSFVSTLKGLGYRYVHAENDWNGTHCGPAVDICMGDAVFEETTWDFLSRTPLASLVERKYPHSHTGSALLRLSQFENWASESESWNGPTLVFVHLIMPHPPLYVNGSCEIVWDASLGGLHIGGSDLAAEAVSKRRSAYVEQAECVNQRVLSLVGSLPQEALVIIIGDHGPDSLGQLYVPIDAWTESDIVERMAVLAAFRFPAGCDVIVPADLSLVNSLRLSLDCLIRGEVPLLENRHFVVPSEDGRGVVTEVSVPSADVLVESASASR